MDAATPFGQWLKARRRALDLTQDVLAYQAGCATVTLKKIEAGVRRPSRQLAKRLAVYLQVSTSDHAAFVDFARGDISRFHHIELGSTTHICVSTQGHLPLPLTPLIGREAEIAAISKMVCDSTIRLLTLTGTGGTGKTRIALAVASAVADTFVDGVCWVDLTAIDTSELFVPTLAQALGLTGRLADGPTESLWERLLATLSERAVLLVLDNFEHLLEAAPLLIDLLRAAPRFKLLVTSRALLHLSCGYVYEVPPLPVLQSNSAAELLQCPSIVLFMQRARTARPSVSLADDALLAVAAICRALDGLPLAIELAAARCAVLSPPELLTRLGDSLALLSGGARDLHMRHRTIQETIAWSFRLLDEAERSLLCQLAIFADGCTLEAAETVVMESPKVSSLSSRPIVDLIQLLVEHSLLRRVAQPDGSVRFLMLSTIHMFAHEQLLLHTDPAPLYRRHAEYLLTIAQDRIGHGPREPQWLARLRAEQSNLRIVLRWALGLLPAVVGDPALGLRLSAAIWEYWQQQDQIDEGRTWLTRACKQTADDQAGELRAARAEALRGLSSLILQGAEPLQAGGIAQQSLELFSALDDPVGMAWALNDLGCVASLQSDLEHAELCHRRSLELFGQAGFEHGHAWALSCLGRLVRMRGDEAAAVDLFEQCLVTFRARADSDAIAWVLNQLSYIAWLQGNLDHAITLCTESLALFRQLDTRRRVAETLHYLGAMTFELGDRVTAMGFLEESMQEWRLLGNTANVQAVRELLAECTDDTTTQVS